MAAVNHFYDEELTARTTSSTSFTNDADTGSLPTILGSALTGSTKYLIIARGIIYGDSIADQFGLQINANETGALILAKSEAISEVGNTAYGNSYFFVHSFTTDSTPGDVEFEFKSVDTDQVCTVDQLSLFIMDLADLGSSNYFETINADPGVGADRYPSPAEDEWTIAGSNLGTDEFAIFAYQRTGVATTNTRFIIQAHAAADSSTSAVRAIDHNEGENTTELRMSGFALRHKASSGTPNFAITTEGGTHDDRGGYGIAIKTSAFADFPAPGYTAATTTLDTTERTMETITSYSPTTTADHLIFGMYTTDAVNTGDRATVHIEDDGTEMRVGDAGREFVYTYDNNAAPQASLFHLDNILSSDTSTYTMRGTANVTNTAEHRWLLILSLELAAGDQTITGTLLARSPTFPTGAVIGSAVTVTGSLLVRSPTFPTGAVNATNTLSGVLLSHSPTFPTGTVTPGNVTLTGVLLARSPTFPTGAVSSAITITGSLLARSPTFPTGSVTLASGDQTVTGSLLARSPTFPIGALPFDVILTGVVLARSGTFPTGSVNATNTLTGVLLSRSPTFPTGAVNATNTITGTLLSRSPTFPTGTVTPGNVTLTGVLLARSPTFPTGSVDQGETITGILLARSPTFPIGILIFTHPGAGLSRGTGPRVASQGTGRRPVMAGSSRPW